MNKRKESVIIVAGGKGLRMGAELPKQFICLNGLPILMHTIRAFYTYSNDIQIILVLPISHQAYWNELVEQYKFTIPLAIANGGETRFHSVKNGLELVSEGALVAVHDGVRPFVSNDLINRCFEGANQSRAVVPAIASKDSLRLVEGDTSRPIERDMVRLIQTPQVFEYQIIRNVYNTEFQDVFTDDASVVEYGGQKIYIVEGEDNNIKITTPFDLKIGEILTHKN